MKPDLILYLLMGLWLLMSGCDSGPGSYPTNDANPLDAGTDAGGIPSIDAGWADTGGDSNRDLGLMLDLSMSDAMVMGLDGGDMSLSDMFERVGDDGGPGENREVIRSRCNGDEAIDTGLEPAPNSCTDLFRAQREREAGCYRLSDGLGGVKDAYCWRHRALVILVNNKIDVPFHAEDLNQDGVIDDGPLAGTNHPADPFDLTHADFSEGLRTYVTDWYNEVSYGSIYLDIDSIYNAPPEAGLPERWFRLLRERPGFANAGIFRQVCEMRGGMTAAQWRSYHVVITIITDGTQVSGSQWRTEDLPVGEDCADTVPILGNYVVMKQFRSWNRRGTLFHEIGHSMNRAPSPAGLGHSESTHAETGEHTEYGDRSDVMGSSSNRGHFSLAQKLFLKVLPEDTIERFALDATSLRTTIFPIERPLLETKGLVVEVNQGRSYYVEARRHIGADQAIPSILKQGVLIKRADPIMTARKSWIVDPTPETPTNNSGDSVLLPGRTFSDAENQVHISLLWANDETSELVVRRGPPSAASPVIDSVVIQEEAEGYRLEASAHAGEGDVPDEELLFFWGLLTPNAMYTPGTYRNGRVAEFQRIPEGGQLWLFVSDQRGGETVQHVNP
jgi:hypothetical protein